MNTHLSDKLFHVLSIVPGVYVSHRTISDYLWPDEPVESRKDTLSQQVTRLRKRLASHLEIDSGRSGHYRLLGYCPESPFAELTSEDLQRTLSLYYAFHAFLPMSFLKASGDHRKNSQKTLWLEAVVLGEHKGSVDPVLAVPIGFVAINPSQPDSEFDDMGILEVVGRHFYTFTRDRDGLCGDDSHRNLLMPQRGMFHGSLDGLVATQPEPTGMFFTPSGHYATLEWTEDREVTVETQGRRHPVLLVLSPTFLSRHGEGRTTTLAEVVVEVSNSVLVAGYVDEAFDLPTALAWIHATIGGSRLDAWRSKAKLRMSWVTHRRQADLTTRARKVVDERDPNPRLDGSFRNLSAAGTLVAVLEFNGLSLDLVLGVLRLSTAPANQWLLQKGQALNLLNLLAKNPKRPVPKHVAAKRVLPMLTAGLGFKASAEDSVNARLGQYVKKIRSLQDGSGTRPLEDALTTIYENKKKGQQAAYCLLSDVKSRTLDQVDAGDGPGKPFVVEPYYAGFIQRTTPEVILGFSVNAGYVQSATKPLPVDFLFDDIQDEQGRTRRCRIEWQHHTAVTQLIKRVPDDQILPLRLYPPKTVWEQETGSVVLSEVFASLYGLSDTDSSVADNPHITLGFDSGSDIGSDSSFGTLLDMLKNGGRIEWRRGDVIYLLTCPPEPEAEPPSYRMSFEFFSSFISFGQLSRPGRLLRLSWAPEGTPFARYLPS